MNLSRPFEATRGTNRDTPPISDSQSQSGTPRLSPAEYPIVIRAVRGYLVASMPDLGIHVSERMSQLSERTIGQLILLLWKKCDHTLRVIQSEGGQTPKSTAIVDLLPNLQATHTWTIKQVATVAGVSEATLRRAVVRGELPCTLTPGGHRRFDETAVRSWMKHRETSQNKRP